MNVIIYTTKTCAYCPMVKQYLKNKGILFTVEELDNDPQKREELRKTTGAMTVPITEFKKESGSKYVVGWNPSKLAEVINES